MALEDLIIAKPILDELGEENINALLDLAEDPSLPMTSRTWVALNRFLTDLVHAFGEDHLAVVQVRSALSVPRHHLPDRVQSPGSPCPRKTTEGKC